MDAVIVFVVAAALFVFLAWIDGRSFQRCLWKMGDMIEEERKRCQ